MAYEMISILYSKQIKMFFFFFVYFRILRIKKCLCKKKKKNQFLFLIPKDFRFSPKLVSTHEQTVKCHTLENFTRYIVKKLIHSQL